MGHRPVLPEASDPDALDAYSEVVIRVAAALLPSIASVEPVEVHRRGPRPVGGGSAVVITPDGYLLTSAHVVQRADRGSLALPDGRILGFERDGKD